MKGLHWKQWPRIHYDSLDGEYCEVGRELVLFNGNKRVPIEPISEKAYRHRAQRVLRECRKSGAPK